MIYIINFTLKDGPGSKQDFSTLSKELPIYIYVEETNTVFLIIRDLSRRANLYINTKHITKLRFSTQYNSVLDDEIDMGEYPSVCLASLPDDLQTPLN